MQDCLTDFLERRDDGHDVADVKSYLFMMVRNRSLDMLRRASFIDRSATDEEFDDIIDEDDREDAAFIEARLWTAIDSLPENVAKCC